MEIIKLQRKDIKNALDLVWTVFEESETRDYSTEGIKEFKNFISYNSIIEKVDNGELHFWGCRDRDDLTGVIATRQANHICLLFVKKEYHKRGIAYVVCTDFYCCWFFQITTYSRHTLMILPFRLDPYCY